jgi:asparagine synthase (glutamine-hydrolysing)
MPGIVGIISNRNSELHEKHVQKMISTMQHEAFYKKGSYKNSHGSVHLKWTCHPNSYSDSFPVLDAEGNMMFISGELFNTNDSSIDFRKEKISDNFSNFMSVYEKKPKDCIETLNGWFCGILIDKKQNEIILFNDRYGMHRVFIYEGPDGFYFASEAKALLAIMAETGFDKVGLSEFMTCGCTLGSHSLYKNISILPQASMWKFKNGKLLSKDCYFDNRKWAEQNSLDEKRYLEQFIYTFDKAVGKYSSNKLPVGISLTGGLDTRMVMSCLGKKKGDFQCYTFGSMYRDTYDVKVAREVAKTCGLSFETLILGDIFLKEFPFFLEKAVQISDGYMGFSGAAELYLNNLARNIAPVRLTGNYGSELLRGARAFKVENPKGDFLRPEMLPIVNEAKQTFKKLGNADPITFALFRQAPLQGYGRLGIENSQVILRTPFMDNDLVKLSYRAPSSLRIGNRLSFEVIGHYYSSLLNIPTDRGLLGKGCNLSGIIRRFEREFYFKAEYLSSYGMPCWLSSIMGPGLQTHLNRLFTGRHKFQHFRQWSQGCLVEYLKDTINRNIRDLSDYFKIKCVQVIIDEHFNGKRNYLNEIDKILTLCLVQRNLLKTC